MHILLFLPSPQLVLENYINGRHAELAGSWLIADIDDWLQGNEFWAKSQVPHLRGAGSEG